MNDESAAHESAARDNTCVGDGKLISTDGIKSLVLVYSNYNLLYKC